MKALVNQWVVFGGLAGLLGMPLWIGCDSKGEDTGDKSVGFEVAANDNTDESNEREPTVDSIAQLAGVSTNGPSATSGTGEATEGMDKPPSMTGTQLDAQQLAVPNGGINQIQAFLQQLYRRRATVSTEEEAIELFRLQREAAEKMMAPGVDEVNRVNAILIKLDALRQLAARQVPETEGEYLDYCALLAKDQNPQIKEQGRIREFEIKTVWFLNNREDYPFDVIKEDLAELVTDPQAKRDTVILVQEFAQAVFLGEHRKHGVEILSIAADAFLRSEDEFVKSAGESFLDQLLMAQLNFDQAQQAVLDGQAGAEQELYNLGVRLITERKPSVFTVDRALMGARILEHTHHYDLALQLVETVAAEANKTEDASVKSFANGARERANIRLNLIGKKIEVDGDLSTGEPFDWSAYRGKVVLVFCWATPPQWSGALQEIDGMIEMYEKYKDKGLEIVGLNADETPQELAFFLTRNPLPWPTVVSNDPESIGMQSPMMRALGIDGSPFNLLVDAEGKVIRLHAYRKALEPAIAEALGIELPPEPETPTPVDPDAPTLNPADTDQAAGDGGVEATTQDGVDQTSAWGTELGNGYSFVAIPNRSQEEVPQVDSNPYLAPVHYSTDELVDFLLDMEEKPRSLLGRTEFVDAVAEAADRVLADTEARSAFRRIAALNKLQSLHRLAILDTPGYEDRLREAVTKLTGETDKRVVAEVQFLQLEGKAVGAAELDDETRAQLLAELKAYFETNKPETKHLRMASATVGIINGIESEQDPQTAAQEREKWFAEFGKIFSESSDRQLAGYGRQLAKAPAASQNSVVGQALKLAGTTHSGLPLDWESYRGKVVVVDFWATWCGPCLRELPNVRRAYDELNDQGFEVIGISIDQDLEALAEFLDREQLPWPTMSGDGAQEKARELGVRAIPTMMLIDANGQIVQVANRIEQLRPQIDKLLAEQAN